MLRCSCSNDPPYVETSHADGLVKFLLYELRCHINSASDNRVKVMTQSLDDMNDEWRRFTGLHDGGIPPSNSSYFSKDAGIMRRQPDRVFEILVIRNGVSYFIFFDE